MTNPNILIFNQNPEERERLNKLCSLVGKVNTADNIEKTIALLESIPFEVAVIDHSLAHYSSLKGLFPKKTSVIITGEKENRIREIVKEWPLSRYVDFYVTPHHSEDNNGFIRSLQSATEHSILKGEVNNLKRSMERRELELDRAFSEIKKIKRFIHQNIVKEMEKRVATQAKFIWFKKEKKKIENILKKLYTANDITTLLDIVYDIKEIVEAKGISLYILEKSETMGSFLKPLVWNDTILSHPDISKHLVLIDSHDYAAFVARHCIEINFNNLREDKRLSERYKGQLNYPLQNILGIPIMHQQKVIGVLEVYNKQGKEYKAKQGFTQDDQQILRTISEHISIAITKLNLIQYDALTGLLRPDPFFDKVIQKLKLESKREERDTSFAMVMGDVDWFKNYNDHNGHEAGNKLLRELAEVLISSTRDEDYLCRYGGEEFLLFLSGIKSVEEALKFTERIRKNIEEHYFEYQEFQPRHNLTMSFGITYFTKDKFPHGESITRKELKKIANEADIALAEAKGKKMRVDQAKTTKSVISYKNKVCTYHPSIEPKYPEPPLSPEENKDKEEKRRFKRFHISTFLIYQKNGKPQVSKTINLSLGGAKVCTSAPMVEDQGLELILILGNKCCKLQGQTIYTIEERGNYYTGIKFKELTFNDRKILESYFSSYSDNQSLN